MEPGKLSGRELLAGFSGLFFLVALFLLGVQFNLVKYENTLRVLTPIGIGIFGTIFALEQLRINRRKSNMDLFDKRFSIYDTVYKFISSVHDYGFILKSHTQVLEKVAAEKERYKKIQSQVKDFNVKITLSEIITDNELANKLNEYREITLKTLELKRKECDDVASLRSSSNSFSKPVIDNEEELKKIVDTKLRADFEKYFTIK